VRAVLKDLPLPVYADADARHGVLNAAQHALDAAIDEEYE
jgi:type III secretion protein W